MSIPVTCSCGQQFMAQPHLAGKRVACPSCGNPLSIPASADQPADSGGESAEANIVSCQCGQSFKAPPHLAGKRVPCPSCGQPIDIPGAAGGGSPQPAPAAPAAASPASPARTKPAAASPKPAGSPKAAATPKPAARAAVAPETDFAWDDALGAPMGADSYGPLGGSPAHAPRRTETEHIQPMTMYAIWIGGGAVVLLILVILGHIIWNFFSDGDSSEIVPDQPVESAPADIPQTSPASPPAEDSSSNPARGYPIASHSRTR